MLSRELIYQVVLFVFIRELLTEIVLDCCFINTVNRLLMNEELKFIFQPLIQVYYKFFFVTITKMFFLSLYSKNQQLYIGKIWKMEKERVDIHQKGIIWINL